MLLNQTVRVLRIKLASPVTNNAILLQGWMDGNTSHVHQHGPQDTPTTIIQQSAVGSVNIQLVGIVLDVLSIKYNFIWIGSIVSSLLKMYPRPPIQFSSNEKMFESQH